MAQDAFVKEADALRGFASDLHNIGSSIAGHCSQLSMVAYRKESELHVCVNRIESALHEAEYRYEQALYEYESYVSYPDRDDFSEHEAQILRAEMQETEARCNEIREDLALARLTLNQAMTVLSNLHIGAQSFAAQIEQLMQAGAANVDAAAYEISQYKSVK